MKIVIPGPEPSANLRLRAVTRRASDVSPQSVMWLWEPHFASGKLSLLVGDPGLSKSTLTVCIASHVTTGKPWPNGCACPVGEVLMVNAEDDPADTTRPRLDAAGALVERVHFLDGVADCIDGSTRSFSLGHVDVIDDFLEQNPDVRLVIIDPISAYMAGVDSHKNTDVRAVLAPIATLAAKHGVAVIAVSHLNKGQGAAIYRSSGSMAFVAASRATYLVARSEDSPEKRVLLPVKNNLGPDTQGVGYALRTTESRVPFIEWLSGPVSMTADEALRSSTEDRRTSTEDCVDWLRAVLSDGEKSASELMDAAERLGFSSKVLRRSREKLAVRTDKAGVKAGWYWSLPINGGGT